MSITRNGAQAAYMAPKDGRNFVVVGDRNGPDFDGEISSLFLSHDGTFVRYHVADMAGTRTLYVNHKPLGDSTMQVKTAVGADVEFSADGSRCAAVMVEGDKEFVLFNGVKGPKFNMIQGLRFGPDRATVAYMGRGSGKDRIMVGDKPIAEAKYIGEFILSRAGKHYAYQAGLAGGSLVVDGNDIIFSPDSSKLAYTAFLGRAVWRKLIDVPQ